MRSMVRHGPYFRTLLAVAAVGYVFGDLPFPGLEELVGDPASDILMAIGGLAVAALLYEIVAAFRGAGRSA